MPALIASFMVSYPSVKHGIAWITALLLLIVLSPLMLLISIAIVLESGRPVFFVQTRAGRNGETFRLIKFRSLYARPHNAYTPDRHATRVGRQLRRFGLDELPQLWNILRGEMTLIGPRPVLLPEIACYDDEQRVRLSVRPGLTGWAQVNGRNALSWSDRARLDVWYVRHQSLSLDLSILLRTPAVLLSSQGVYGPGNRDPHPGLTPDHAHL